MLKHDIRNDMTAIRGHAEFVEPHVDPEGEEFVEVIQRRSESVVRLLEDTDTLIETLDSDHQFEAVDLSTVLDDRITSVTDDHPEVTVHSDVPDGLWVVADGLVHQVFSNLLGNAVAHNDPEALTIRVRAAHNGDVVETVVADDGKGIAEDARDSIFELGEKGPESGGDGLGLYLIARLADVYGGSVTVDESREGGARFVVTLPAATVGGN